jgi:DNA-binding phage protein
MITPASAGQHDMTKLATFRASDQLDSEETVVEYLTAAAEDENPEVLLSAISEIARARGVARVTAPDHLICAPIGGIGGLKRSFRPRG